MTFQEFDKYVEEMFGELQKLKSTKGREYTEGSPDRFANFNKLAQELKLHRYKVWQVYFAKHLSAIYSYIENGREFSEENIQGRIKDAVMYLLLLGGMIQDGPTTVEELIKHTDLLNYEHRETWAEIPSLRRESGKFPLQCNWESKQGRCLLKRNHTGEHKA